MSQLTREDLNGVITYDPELGSVMRSPTQRLVDGSNSKGYKRIFIKGKVYSLHRIIWLYMTGSWPKGVIDHKDGDVKNNSWNNLRDVTNKENLQNTKKASRNSKTGLLGVYPYYSRYRAALYIDGKSVCLGSFSTPEEAHEVYLQAKAKFYPAFIN